MQAGLKIKKKIIKLYYSMIKLEPKAPGYIRKNFRESTIDGNLELMEILEKKYFSKMPEGYLENLAGLDDLDDHMNGRLDDFRITYIPFIDHHRKLNGARVLEIGGGTGCSTLALAEQGAEIASIDLDPEAQEISKTRLGRLNNQVNYHVINATEIDKTFKKDEFDIIIYFAALEHMTYRERIESLRKSWDILKPGGMLCIFEAPNRLWFYDSHTSFMPFYYWLQDDIAIDYGKFSERQIFHDAVEKKMDTTTFSRWGRGVSFHEFELAIDNKSALKYATGLFSFLMKGKRIKQFLYRFNLDSKYKKIMRKIAPDHIGSPFLEPFLDLALIKKTDG